MNNTENCKLAQCWPVGHTTLSCMKKHLSQQNKVGKCTTVPMGHWPVGQTAAML